MQKEDVPKELRERTYHYARRIIRALPKDDVTKTFGRQLLRSAF